MVPPEALTETSEIELLNPFISNTAVFVKLNAYPGNALVLPNCNVVAVATDVNPVYEFEPDNVMVLPPAICTTPVPLIFPANVYALLRLIIKVPLLTIFPTITPMVPALPICSVAPDAIVVPPVKLFVPVKTNVPELTFNAPDPLITPL